MKLREFKDKKILILGFGKEGRDTLKFLRKNFPQKIIGIGDRLNFENLDKEAKELIKKEGKYLRLHLGENYLNFLKNYDLIFKSPGIPIHLPEIEKAFKDKKIISQTEIFLKNCPGKVIGITGTKGKSTTAALIYNILKEGGLKAHLVGNIGKPVLNFLFSAKKEDIFVYELSSHQLYNLKVSPQVAIFLNIYPEHLDYYKNFKEYLFAKQNITRFQKKEDYFIFNSQDKYVRETAKITKAKKIPIKGEFYQLNKNAARAVGRIFKIPPKIVEKAIEKFKGLPHRLELVGKFKGITFYNDALSTIPETTMFAIKTLGNKVQTVFLGGFDRKINFKKLARFILKNKNIKNLILFPTTGEKIWQEISKYPDRQKTLRHFFVDNMPDAVKLAYKYTQKGKICLLSCASSSFSIFKNYREKGRLFKKYVKKYGRN
jgi:UDP-N-acetylmuramoylalanine--D-glutamate ligase